LLTGKTEGKRKEKQTYTSQHINLILKKLLSKGAYVLTAIRVLKLTYVACSLCNKLFHKKCVPNHNKMHIPEEQEDSYVCHMISVCI
jgi:hypothetical protein